MPACCNGKSCCSCLSVVPASIVFAVLVVGSAVLARIYCFPHYSKALPSEHIALAEAVTLIASSYILASVAVKVLKVPREFCQRACMGVFSVALVFAAFFYDLQQKNISVQQHFQNLGIAGGFSWGFLFFLIGTMPLNVD